MDPDTQTMDRVAAPAGVQALKDGREVLALTRSGWERVVAVERHRARAGHTWYAVQFASGYVRVFRAGGVFWARWADDAA